MSELLDRVREKYPAYRDVPDDDLAYRLGGNYPQYLEQDPEFKAEYQQAFWKRVKSYGADQNGPASFQQTPNFNLQTSNGDGANVEVGPPVQGGELTPEWTSVLGQLPRALFMPSDEQAARSEAMAAQNAKAREVLGPEEYQRRLEDIQFRYDSMRRNASWNQDPRLAAILDQREQEEMANLGVTSVDAFAGANLPKLTEEEGKALFGQSRMGKAAAQAQRIAAGVAEGFVSPEGLMMTIPGAKAGLGMKLTKAEEDVMHATGRAFVGDMAKSVTEQASQAAGYYSAGDEEAGDAALMSATSILAMMGIPVAAAHLKPAIKSLVEQGRRSGVSPEIEQAAVAGGEPAAETPTSNNQHPEPETPPTEEAPSTNIQPPKPKTPPPSGQGEGEKTLPGANVSDVFEPEGPKTTEVTESEQTPTEETPSTKLQTPKTGQRAEVGAGGTAPSQAAGDVRPAIGEIAAMLRKGPVSKADVARLLEKAYGGTLAEGKFTAKDLSDVLEMGANRLILDSPNVAETLNAPPELAIKNVKHLKTLLERMPTQTTRTGEMDRLQQFSTPPPLSYVANWVAALKPSDVVLEPSAGVGGLGVMAKAAGARVIGNELSAARANFLKQSGVADVVLNHNAEHLNALLRPGIDAGTVPQPTAVVMNPPFSNAATTNRKNTLIGANHVAEALKLLPEGGRLVAIVGNGMAEGRAMFAPWWKQMKERYNVRANIQVNGEEYRKYGTSFDNQLVVIDKNGPTPEGGTVAGRVEKVEDLIPLLEGIRNERPTGIEQTPAEPSGAETAGAGGPGGNAESNAPVVAGAPGLPGRAGGTPGAVQPVREGAGGLEPTGRRKAGGGTKGTGGKPNAGVGAGLEPGAAKQPDGGHLEGGERRADEVAAKSEGISLEKLEQGQRQLKEQGVFSEYHPRKVKIAGAHPHPTALVEPTAMAAVEPVDPTYVPKLPRKMITEGRISAAGIENVVYAGQAHSKLLPNGQRMGYFIGDGTGVGKGRQLGSIIMDNWNQGRKKHVWVSKSSNLIHDAKRDLGDLGFDVTKLIDFWKNGGRNLIGAKEGVAFVPYSSLRSGNPGLTEEGVLHPPTVKGGVAKPSRMHLLYDWLGKDFDGVIVFDEAHQAGNAIDIKGKRGLKAASEQGKTVLDIQRLYPQARIVYASATGATDVTNLSYADRLGIWGPGTPFESKQRFFNEIKAGGLSAMEIVARDLKSMGRYLARTLSFEGVEHRALVHKLTAEQHEIYDSLARAWQYVLEHRDETMARTGAANDGQARSAANSAFYGAQQRFYNQLLTALQMPSVLKDVRAQLEQGHSAVLQLVNTDEAVQARQIALKASEASEGDNYLEDMDLSPKETLQQYIAASYPTALYEAYEDENGNRKYRPVRDEKGNLVDDPEALRRKQELQDKVGLLKAPSSPLGMLLDTFGADKVAEITGRNKRVVNKVQPDGTVKRVLETNRGPAQRKVEAEEFQSGKRRILVFSDAGGTGFSYHASRKAKNQQRRIHYLIQAGWRADTALQGFGRTHRADQASAPMYVLVSTDIKGHQRFISTIARRLSELGALTGGERKSAGGEMFDETSNLENQYADDGLTALFHDLHGGAVPGMNFQELSRKLGYSKILVDERSGELRQVNTLIDQKTGGLNPEKVPTIQQFLNRILSLEVPEQNAVFDAFIERMHHRIANAKADGSYDPGTQTLKALSIRKLSDEQVYKDPNSTAATRLVEVAHDHPTRMIPWEELQSGDAVRGYALNNRSARLYALKNGPTRTLENGAVVDTFYRYHPGGYDIVPRAEVNENNFTKLSEPEAQQVWNKQVAALPKVHTDKDTYVVGAFLPIWDRLKIPDPRIWRVTTDHGETFLGAQVPARSVAGVRRRLGAGAGDARTPEDIFRAVLERGEPQTLANDWQLKRVRVSGENRIEVTGLGYGNQNEFTDHIGGFMERIQYKPRFFLPTDESAGIAAMSKLLEKAPVAGKDEGLATNEMTAGGGAAPDRATRMVNAARGLMLERMTPDKLRIDGSLKSQHVERVAARLNDPVLKTIAYLHDLVEDTNTSHQEILDRFGERIADAVEAETWRKGKESYQEYIERVAQNPDAAETKLADIADNLAMPEGWDRNPDYLAKRKEYVAAKVRLEQAMRYYEPTVQRATIPDGLARAQWQRKQIHIVVNRVNPAPEGEQPVAIFMGGGPGAGKTTIKEQWMAEGHIDKNAFVDISADDFKTGKPEIKLPPIPEYQSLLDKRDKFAARVVHKESSMMARATMARAIEENKNFTFDGTMSNAASDIPLIEAARDAGYRVVMIGVTLDVPTAFDRAKKRAERSGRHVDVETVTEGHRGFSQSWPKYVPHTDEAHLFDNSGTRPVKIAGMDEGKGLAITDRKAYGLFSERGQERAGEFEAKPGSTGPETPSVRPAEGADVPGEFRRGAEASGGAGGQVALPSDLAGVVTHGFSGGTTTLSVVRDFQRVQAAVAPQTLTQPARFAANALREFNGVMANEMARADAALRGYRKEFDRTPTPRDFKYDASLPLPRNLAFIDAYEGGNTAGMTPIEARAAAEMAKQNGDWLARVHALGTGALQTLVLNYFPHLWNDPARARDVIARTLAKSPLEGPKSFLKKRTHQLFRDGLEAGLTPVHDNPVDLWLLKKREVERYIMAHSFTKEMREAKQLKFVHVFSKAPEGWSTVNDRAFQVFGPPMVKIKEAFDAGMREKTLEVLRDLGIPNERLVKLGGQRWGMEQDVPGKPGTERIKTKFGGPDFVMWHEMGHALDNRYKDLRETVLGPEAKRAQVSTLLMRGQPIPKHLERTARLNEEMRALADARFEGTTPTAAFRSNVRTTTEKIATVLQAYLHAPDRMEQIAPTVKEAFEGFLRVHPELAKIDEIRPGLRLGEAEAQMPINGMVKLGNWYLPDAAARVVNNFLSPGLNTHLWYRTLKESSNLLNGVQLGLSAFHLGFTSLDAATSRLAVGIEDAMHGDFAKAVRTVASVPFAPVTNIMQGARLRREVLKPGSTDAETAALVRALEQGGGRIGQDAFWRTEFTRRMARAFREGTATGYARGALNAPFALFEQTLRPVMEYLVPRQKLGVFADMAKRELLRLGPNADAGATRAAMQRAWDSVDNRMGQLVYDNLFYNRAVKDVALLTFRAYGWQLGKYREGLGALYDVGKAGKALVQRERPEFTHRMAYAMALPLMVGTLGGVLNYLMTGKMPSGMDWFQPQTGEKDHNGNPVRVNFPSYIKDVIAYWKRPLTSFGHSLNPLGSTIFDLLENRDFYDVRIRNPDDPLLQQISDVARFASKQFVPFSVSGAMKLREDASPVAKQIMPFFGVTPVPTRLTMTPAQALASDLIGAQMSTAPRTQEQFDRSKLIREIVTDLKSGDRAKVAEGRAKFFDGIKRSELTPGAITTLIDKMQYTPLQFQIHTLDSESSMRVWRVANAGERAQIQPLILAKVLYSKTLSLDAKQKFVLELKRQSP